MLGYHCWLHLFTTSPPEDSLLNTRPALVAGQCGTLPVHLCSYMYADE